MINYHIKEISKVKDTILCHNSTQFNKSKETKFKESKFSGAVAFVHKRCRAVESEETPVNFSPPFTLLCATTP
jgi:hypothetical protein